VRIRQIKPSFWQDSRIAALPPAARLFYVGLWMVADDAGYLRWDTVEVANELYGYEGRKRRERDVASFMERLVEVGRVELYPCGHARIPTLTDHQRLAGETKQVRTVEKEHRNCPRIPAGDAPRESPLVPDTERLGKERKGNGSVRNGQSSRARTQGGAPRETDDESEFRAKVPRPS